MGASNKLVAAARISARREIVFPFSFVAIGFCGAPDVAVSIYVSLALIDLS